MMNELDRIFGVEFWSGIFTMVDFFCRTLRVQSEATVGVSDFSAAQHVQLWP